MLCKDKITSIFCIIDDILKKLIILKIFAEKCLIVRLLQRHLQLLRFYKKLPYLCPVKERKDKLFFIYQILWLELVKESASSLLFFTPWFLLKGFPLFFGVGFSSESASDFLGFNTIFELFFSVNLSCLAINKPAF